MHHLDDHGEFRHPRPAEAPGLVAVVATLSKGYDLDYIWKQVDRGPAKDAASYYIQASETGGESPGRRRGPGAQALGLEPGQVIEREPYDLLFGERKAPDGTQWSPRTLVDRFPLCRIYIKNVSRSLKTHRAHFPQAALFPDAVVIALDVVEYRGPGLFGIQPQMLVDELFLDRGVR